MDKDRISPIELAALVVGFTIGSSLVLSPGGVGRSGWLAFALGTAEGLLITWIYLTLSRRFGQRNFIEISRSVFGPVLGLLPALLFFWYALHLGGLVLGNFGDYFNIAVLIRSPVAWFSVPLALTAVYAVRNGIEVLARTAVVLIPVTILTVLVLFAVLAPAAKIENLLPLVDTDLKSLLRATHGAAMFPFAQSVLFMMMLPHLTPGRRAAKPVLGGVLFSGLLLVTISLRNISVLGGAVDSAAYPSHAAARLVEVGDVFTRVEILIAVNFLTMGFLRTGAALYAASTSLADILRMRSYRPLVLPVALLMVILSETGFAHGYAENVVFARDTWPVYAVLFTLILPLVTLLTAIVTRRPREGKT